MDDRRLDGRKPQIIPGQKLVTWPVSKSSNLHEGNMWQRRTGTLRQQRVNLPCWLLAWRAVRYCWQNSTCDHYHCSEEGVVWSASCFRLSFSAVEIYKEWCEKWWLNWFLYYKLPKTVSSSLSWRKWYGRKRLIGATTTQVAALERSFPSTLGRTTTTTTTTTDDEAFCCSEDHSYWDTTSNPEEIPFQSQHTHLTPALIYSC